tara:strand:+ start:904 stop:1077 length:174 start_codon:yes stop_codon:yes gene_type:complete
MENHKSFMDFCTAQAALAGNLVQDVSKLPTADLQTVGEPTDWREDDWIESLIDNLTD